ncbi:hypothetical protein FQR65_LT05484 [Abscondita terminalis]|nr:hypothetical protein FQR65_LT05484 [Abscondita terminalis]
MIGSVIASAIVLGVGPFVSFKVLAVICALPSGIFCAIIYFAPESPYYLIKINKRQAASDVLKSLSKTQNSDNWLKEVETSVQQDEASKLTIRKLFLQTNYRNALLHVIAVKSLLQFGGYYAITAYLQTIMEESHTSLSAETSSVIFAVVQIPCVLISAYLIDTWGRRPLLMMSSAGCAVALIGEGTYFYLLQTQNVDLSSVYFLPTLFLVVFYIMLAVGIGSLPYVISGELFASNVKKIGGSMFAFYSGLLSFVNIKVFNPIAEAWGMHAVFWIFAGVCMCGIFYGLFVLPETKGKTFEEIQRNLGKKEEPVKKETSN